MRKKYPGWVLSPEQIYDAVGKENVAGCERVVYNVICQLRRKLKNPDMIQTVIRRGYKFVE
ncbi:helix-turn-helix domain-containing protein [Ruminococcus sp. 5_1_39BFAA]|uniref:winged helix-turn-helix domain-containing protein n=1 Tax=Ruminococcus sp. 5_1_39BFAA TaxID=457412 RepID=UPI00356885AC